MAWNPIIVGVDGSSESACAAALGDYMGRRTGTECRLVHAAADLTVAMMLPEASCISVESLSEEATSYSRQLIALSLEGLPGPWPRPLDVRIGRPSVVLSDAAEACDAEVVVLGCKHRGSLARLAGSTIPHMIRRGTVPVLATDRPEPQLTRVLAAVDLSWAAEPTIAAAQYWASSLGASLRVMHTVEPVPVVPGVSLPAGNELFFRAARTAAEAALGPLISHPGAELVVRRGLAAAAISTEAARWSADLIVVGSHGRGWVDRFLIGSTSERLLHVLPAPLLVIPVSHLHHAPRRHAVPAAECAVG